MMRELRLLCYRTLIEVSLMLGISQFSVFLNAATADD